jgi:hypothetical protein
MKTPASAANRKGDALDTGQIAGTDRVVDHVDAVANRGVDGQRKIGAHRLAEFAAGCLVGDDVRSGGDAADRAQVSAQDLRGHASVAGCCAGGVRAVAVVITG